MKIFTAIAVVLTLSGCATQPEKMSKTQSGWPEVIIHTNDKSYIKENIINRQSSSGWNLEQETESTLLFTKVDDSGSMDSMMTQMMIGNSYSTQPKYEVKYILNNFSGKTKIIVNVAVSTQMPMGQVNRMFLNDNNNVYNSYQIQLDKVKVEIEQGGYAK